MPIENVVGTVCEAVLMLQDEFIGTETGRVPLDAHCASALN